MNVTKKIIINLTVEKVSLIVTEKFCPTHKSMKELTQMLYKLLKAEETNIDRLLEAIDNSKTYEEFIKSLTQEKENKKMVLIDRDEIIEKLKKAANYHKKEVNNKTTVGIDLALHKAQWKAFEDAIFQCKHCEEKTIDVKKEDTAPFEVSTTGKYNSPMKIAITRLGQNHVSFSLNGKQLSWSQFVAQILPGLDCVFGQFCSKRMTAKLTWQLGSQVKVFSHEFEFLKELDCFKGTQEEIESGFKERVYRIKAWMDDRTPRTIEFEL